MKILAIDPGKAGAYAFWDGASALAEPMPILGDEIDLGELRKEWAAFAPDLAIVEEPFPGMKMSKVACMTFGRSVGRLEGILAGLGIPYQTVRPQSWKRVVLEGTAKDKEAAILYVMRRFPDVPLVRGNRRKAHDGIADSLCMLVFAMGRP